MEVIGVVDILNFCWVEFGLECSEIILVVFSLVFSCKCVLHWVLETSFVFFIDGLASSLSETLSKKILTSGLWDVSSISWYMLGLKVLGWSTYPVFASD